MAKANALTRRYGPLPAWGWLVVLVGGTVAYRTWRAQQTPATTALTLPPSTEQPAAAPTTTADVSAAPAPADTAPVTTTAAPAITVQTPAPATVRRAATRRAKTPAGSGAGQSEAGGVVIPAAAASSTAPGSAPASASAPVAPAALAGSGYANPLRGITGLTGLRIDQGVDYSGSGPVYALGPGTIVNTSPSGWPGVSFISEKLSSGPFAGKIVYAAENITPTVTPGQKVTSATQIGTLHNAYPYSEFGFAAPSGTNAIASTYYQEGQQTAAGVAFNRLLVDLGAKSGQYKPGATVGSLPPGYNLPAPKAPAIKPATGGLILPTIGKLSYGQLEGLWIAAGGNPAKAAEAAAVAMAESSGNISGPLATNVNGNGTTDRGLWQINSIHGSQSTYDPLANVQAAIALSGNGTNWSPWTTYNSGAYKSYYQAGVKPIPPATVHPAPAKSALAALPSSKPVANRTPIVQNLPLASLVRAFAAKPAATRTHPVQNLPLASLVRAGAAKPKAAPRRAPPVKNLPLASLVRAGAVHPVVAAKARPVYVPKRVTPARGPGHPLQAPF